MPATVPGRGDEQERNRPRATPIDGQRWGLPDPKGRSLAPQRFPFTVFVSTCT
jgi:hypothetical protein